jgi:hypothetical protein
LINTIDEGALPIDEVGGFDEHGSSIALLEGTIVCLNHTM